MGVPNEQLIEFTKSIKGILLRKPKYLPENNLPATFKTDPKKVFIVHGHNKTVLHEVSNVISKIELIPIVLHEQVNNGQTIIEKFEKHSDIGAAIVILTADDLGKSKTEECLNNRARQNVILELGYFIGKLGRNKVIPLYERGVEIPSDFNGVIYEELDSGGNWKFKIIRELNAIGYNVDANKIL